MAKSVLAQSFSYIIVSTEKKYETGMVCLLIHSHAGIRSSRVAQVDHELECVLVDDETHFAGNPAVFQATLALEPRVSQVCRQSADHGR